MLYSKQMKWKVILSSKANKQLKKLPEKVNLLAQLLARDLGMFGTCPGKQWPNFSKLSNKRYHCHLAKGKPTYVACWQLIDKLQRKIEVYYVGTHENAPY
jgi:mRNA-degrading endonuclease RelE of RelBE toxin-antitoxin system